MKNNSNNPIQEITNEFNKILSSIVKFFIDLISKGTLEASKSINDKFGKKENYESSVKERFKRWRK
jgi:hypothetical protein